MRKYRHFISLGLLLCAVVFAQLAPPAFAQQYVTTPAAVSPEKQLTPAEAKARQEWRKSMLQIPAPSGECQRATFPNRKWEKVPCTTAPQVPFFPAPKRHPFTLGGTGGDFVTSVTGVIVSAEGAFAGAGQGAGALNNVTVSGGTDPAIDNVTGAYSLMLNTSPLPAAGLCPNTLPDCGWEQFIFMNGTDGTAKAFIQFWLIGVASKNGCPNDTWNYFPGAPQSSPGCWINSRAVDIPLQPVTNIPSLSLTGTAVVGGRDTVALATEEAIYRPAADENQDLNLAGNWHQFEFNVVGPGSGSQANFNQGATLAVRTSVLNGAGIGPDQCP